MSLLPFDDRDGFIWLNGTILPWREAKIHALTHGLHYGSCVFDGERAYRGTIFKSQEHSRRLKRSAEWIDLDVRYSIAELEQAKAELVRRNGGGDQYIRAFAWRGSEMMALGARQAKTHVAIASWEWPSMFDPETKWKGIRLELATWRRPNPACAPVHAKAAGLYMISTLAKHRAERNGFADALMLDWEGRVAECTGANIFFVAHGSLHTPIADCFLDGITRQTVIELATRRGIAIVERRIFPEELSVFSECFICGTAAEITPVREIGAAIYEPAAISRLLIEDYRNAVLALPVRD